MSVTRHDDRRKGSADLGEQPGSEPIYYSHDRMSYGRPVDELTEEERAARAGDDWIYADASEWTDTDLPGRPLACAMRRVRVLHRAADDTC